MDDAQIYLIIMAALNLLSNIYLSVRSSRECHSRCCASADGNGCMNIDYKSEREINVKHDALSKDALSKDVSHEEVSV